MEFDPQEPIVTRHHLPREGKTRCWTDFFIESLYEVLSGEGLRVKRVFIFQPDACLLNYNQLISCFREDIKTEVIVSILFWCVFFLPAARMQLHRIATFFSGFILGNAIYSKKPLAVLNNNLLLKQLGAVVEFEWSWVSFPSLVLFLYWDKRKTPTNWTWMRG